MLKLLWGTACEIGCFSDTSPLKLWNIFIHIHVVYYSITFSQSRGVHFIREKNVRSIVYTLTWPVRTFLFKCTVHRIRKKKFDPIYFIRMECTVRWHDQVKVIHDCSNQHMRGGSTKAGWLVAPHNAWRFTGAVLVAQWQRLNGESSSH